MENEVGNRIHFENEIILNNTIHKGEARVHYQLIKYRLMVEYKILEDINANFTLVQFMDSLVIVNHAISVVGNWMFDSNY